VQSETADFASGAATWLTVQNIRVVFDFDLFAPLFEHNVIHKIVRGVEFRAMSFRFYRGVNLARMNCAISEALGAVPQPTVRAA